MVGGVGTTGTGNLKAGAKVFDDGEIHGRLRRNASKRESMQIGGCRGLGELHKLISIMRSGSRHFEFQETRHMGSLRSTWAIRRTITSHLMQNSLP